MADAPPLDATFFAFRKRDQRFVLTRAAVGYVIGYMLILALYLALLWPSLTSLYAWYFELLGEIVRSEGDPPPLPGGLMSRWPAFILIALLGIVLFAAFEAACLRWLVRGERGGGLLGLTLGRETWLVLAVYLAWIALSIVFCALVVALYAILIVLGQTLSALQLLWALLAALTPLAILALLIWVSVRLAPAAAMSVGQNRFVFFGAWGATRPYFWQLLGAFVVLWIGYFVIAMIVGTITQLPMNQAMMPIVEEAMTSGDAEALAAQLQALLSSPLMLASMAANLIASVILACVLSIAYFGVNARAATAAAGAPAPSA